MGYLRINRKGNVQLLRSSHNQCKARGHKHFTYAVSCIVHDNDIGTFNQFIVDHQDIHNTVEAVFKRNSGSCEKLAKTTGKELYKLFTRVGRNPIELYVRIEAIPDSSGPVMAFMEWSFTGTFNTGL